MIFFSLLKKYVYLPLVEYFVILKLNYDTFKFHFDFAKHFFFKISYQRKKNFIEIRQSFSPSTRNKNSINKKEIHFRQLLPNGFLRLNRTLRSLYFAH